MIFGRHSVLKRGCSKWDPALVPQAEFDARLDRVRRELARRNLDALVIYGDNYSFGDLCYLTNYFPKVRGGIAVVPRDGAISLLLNIGSRDVPFAETLTWVDDVRASNQIGSAGAGLIQEKGAPAMPQSVPAAHKGDMGGYAIFGMNSKTGRPYVCQNIIGGGWGGRPFEDGISSAVSMCQGDVKNTPIELQELYYPLLYECHELRADSGGAGKFRGGNGIVVRVTPLERCFLSRNTDRIKCPPWGLLGGAPAMVNETRIERGGKDERLPGKFSQMHVQPGETVTFLTAGGGGYGAPEQREAEAVKRDLALGYVSRQGARRNYAHAFAAGRAARKRP